MINSILFNTPPPVMKVCIIPELFLMPVPLNVNLEPEAKVMVKGFVAAGVNVIPPTSVRSEVEILVMFERLNVAVSGDPLGTVVGVQLAAVFQSPEPGLRFHVALPACAKLAIATMVALSSARRAVFLIR